MDRLDDLIDALAELDSSTGETAATSIRQPESLRRAAQLAVGLGMDDSVTAATNHALEQRIRGFARQQALADHLRRFPGDRPALGAVARRRVIGTGHPAEQSPEVIDDVAAWVERHDPDWISTSLDESVDDVLRIAEMIIDGVGARSSGAA